MKAYIKPVTTAEHIELKNSVLQESNTISIGIGDGPAIGPAMSKPAGSSTDENLSIWKK